MARQTVIISDIHSPEQDDKAVELACKVIDETKPDAVVIDGDSVDFREVSDFPDQPSVRLLLQSSIDKALEKHKEIKSAAPDAKYYFILGNHERRWLRFLMKNPVLESLESLTFEEILSLKKLGFELVKKSLYLVGGKLLITHGRRWSTHAGRAVQAELNDRKNQISVIVGHGHKSASITMRGPRMLVGGWEIGCLQNLRPHYHDGEQANWIQSMAVLNEWGNADSQHFNVEEIVFTGVDDEPRRCIFRGKEFEVK